MRPATPWRLVCFGLSPKTASVLSHIYRMPTQGLSQHLSSTLPPPTQVSHTPAHFLISHFSYCLLYPWSDLHSSSEPQVSPSLRSLGSHCEPHARPWQFSFLSSPVPRLPRGLLRLPFCKVFTDSTKLWKLRPSQDGGLGYLRTLSFSGQVHGANVHTCLAGLMVQVSAKTFMKSIEENRQSLRLVGSVLGMLPLFFLSRMDSVRISVLNTHPSTCLPLAPVPGKSLCQLNIHTTIWIPHQNFLDMV